MNEFAFQRINATHQKKRSHIMNLQYPIGKYVAQDFSKKLKNEWLTDIKFLPNEIENAVATLDNQQIQTPYREGGWTIHQLVHHVADSHMHAYIRFKTGFSESNPSIMPYDEKVWADYTDVKNLPVDLSISLLYALHRRWQEFMAGLNEQDFQKTIYHPLNNQNTTLWHLLGFYAWHGKHHVAQITQLNDQMMW